MTRAQAKEKLVAMGVEEPTEEQVTALLNTIKGEVDGVKEQLNTANQQLKDAKNNSHETELQTMVDDLNQQIADLKRTNVRAEVKAILAAAQLTEDDYKDFIDGFVSEDVKASTAMANAFAKTLANQRTNAENKLKESMLDGTKNLGGNGGSHDPDPDEEPADVKFVKSMNFGTKPDAKSAFDYYK